MSTIPELEPQASSTEKIKPPLVITREQAMVIHQKLRWGRYIALGSYAGLILLLTLLNLLRDDGNLKILMVQIIPLLIFIPSLLRATHRTYSWLCFVSLMYFVVIVPLLMTRGLWSDWIIMLLSCTLFVAAMMTSRWLQYWNYYLTSMNQQTT
jgi:uncharacterized membrane protein